MELSVCKLSPKWQFSREHDVCNRNPVKNQALHAQEGNKYIAEKVGLSTFLGSY